MRRPGPGDDAAGGRVRVEMVGRGREARARKADSGHIGTISIAVRMLRASWNVMEPWIQCVLAQWIPGFIAPGSRPLVMINMS